jgi:hypothetical protein
VTKAKAEERQEKLPLASAPDLTEADLEAASQRAQLPLEREAAKVKSVKASWHKQLIEEEALDGERGTLRGKPLAVFNVHGRTCPPAPHVHLLWERSEGTLRLSLFFLAMVDDPRYEGWWKQRQRRLEAHSDLLALLLAPTASYDTKSASRKQMRIDTYQLSLSLDAYKVLEMVQHKRATYQRDLALWHWWVQSNSLPEQEEHAAPGFQEAVTRAREVLKELGELGVRVAHPELVERKWRPGGGYSTDRHHVISRSEIEVPANEVSRPQSSLSRGNDRHLLYWEQSWPDNPFEDEEEASPAGPVTDATMRRLWRTHGYALRLALSEPALEEAQKRTEDLARSYATTLSLLQDARPADDAESTQRALPAPTTVWECIREQKQSLEEYCQRWNESIQRVSGLEQLFVG